MCKFLKGYDKQGYDQYKGLLLQEIGTINVKYDSCHCILV